MSKNSINYQSASFYGLKKLLNELKVFLKLQLRRMKKVKRTTELINDIYEKIRKDKLISLKKMSFETYIHGGNTLRWCLLDNKVCFGKYISSDVRSEKLQKYKGTRVGYGYYGSITLEEAKNKCKNDTNCQSFFEDRNYGYYYYTGKDSYGNLLNDSHPDGITDLQKGVCTSENAKVENRGTGATLYIKKNKMNEAASKAKAAPPPPPEKTYIPPEKTYTYTPR